MSPVNGSRWARDIRLGSLALPIPNWCIPLFGVIAVLYVAYSLLATPVQTVYTRYTSGKTEESDAAEAYRHFADNARAVIKQDMAGGVFEARLFSDGCISVAWQDGVSGVPPHPHFIRKALNIGGPAPGPTEPPAVGLLSSGPVLAAGTPRVPYPAAVNVQYKCLNPHPGQFTWKYGDRVGCWVQVWRQFDDGCLHYQWFNTCGNFWDVYPNGTPKVYWTQCRH